ncbi:hypothetical protein MJG53_003175 [Ovis ammon polii x Ovis aries]|uniref:Uncharacterized protein n=2 Tax=Ovis TaxID=9935 RepID=A0A836AN48_SHEEP|nr:hypothetical protein JEQ12_009342 [Ovis aries]KAI4588767.1 hypothetical protein MJG53_003175 [Ovis ammon polii x Ovis aries]
MLAKANSGGPTSDPNSFPWMTCLLPGMAYVSAIRGHKTIGSACLCKVNTSRHISIRPQAFVMLYRVLPSTKAMWLTLKKPEGREHLRRLLNWEEFDELRDSRRSILLDTLYESIIFAVGKGFPWGEVAQVVKFTEELLKETKGCSVTEAVTVLGNKLRDHQGQFNTTHLLALCDYFHNTFIRHYKLYQYVLGQDRDVNLTVTNLEVCTPPQPLPLAEGKDREVWKHEQQLEGLSTAEVQKRTHMLLLKGALRLEQQHLLRETFSRLPGRQHQTLNREELEKLINEAIHIQIECLKELLQYEIQITFDILDLKLQKKTLNLNAPIPPLVPIAGQSGQDEALKLSKTNKGKKAKAKK